MTYNQKAAMRSYRGAESRAAGEFFERLIGEACAVYRSAGIALSRLSGEQREALLLHQRLGAAAGILAGFGGGGRIMGAWIPISVFLDAKKENGHLYWSREDAAPWEVPFEQGILNFLGKRGRVK